MSPLRRTSSQSGIPVPCLDRRHRKVRQKSPADHGFTLLELAIAVAILAIMTALILPQMRGTYGDALLRRTSRELVGLCQLASSRAISFNQDHRVLIDPRSGKYELQRRQGPRNASESFRPVRDLAGVEGQIDSRIQVELRRPGAAVTPSAGDSEEMPRASGSDSPPGTADLVFHPDGTAEDVEILLRDPDGFALILRVHPVTSRVQVSTLPP